MSTSENYRIAVDVRSEYIEEQSAPDEDRFVFAYHVTIRNEGSVPARLLSRHWIITNGDGEVQEVEGRGVVGEQPYLRPGEVYEYTSGTALETPVGAMHGSYHMLADDGNEFDAEISPFTLSQPRTLH